MFTNSVHHRATSLKVIGNSHLVKAFRNIGQLHSLTILTVYNNFYSFYKILNNLFNIYSCSLLFFQSSLYFFPVEMMLLYFPTVYKYRRNHIFMLNLKATIIITSISGFSLLSLNLCQNVIA